MEKDQNQPVADQEPPVAPVQTPQPQVSPPPPYVVVTAMAHQPRVVLNVQQPLMKTYAEPVRARKKSVIALGIMQIIAALMFTTFGIAAIFEESYFSVVGAPVWTGVFFCLPAGICGILSALSKPKRRCLAVAGMIMSIFASIGSFVVIGLSSTSLSMSYNCYYNGYCEFSGYMIRAQMGLESCNVIVGLFEFIVSILAASYSCCCVIPNKPVAEQRIVIPQNQGQFLQYGTQAPTAHAGPTVYVNPGMQPQQYTVVAPPQGMVNQSQPAMFVQSNLSRNV